MLLLLLLLPKLLLLVLLHKMVYRELHWVLIGRFRDGLRRLPFGHIALLHLCDPAQRPQTSRMARIPTKGVSDRGQIMGATSARCSDLSPNEDTHLGIENSNIQET